MKKKILVEPTGNQDETAGHVVEVDREDLDVESNEILEREVMSRA